MGSYRPIAHMCIHCKLMKRIILRRITHHLLKLNLMPEEQYGFQRGHNTTDKILYFAQSVRDTHNKKTTNHIISVYLDIIKAFDKNSRVCIQWIPSYVGVFGNEMVDLLAKEGNALRSAASNEHFVSEIFSIHRSKANSLWRVPSTHDSYDENRIDLSLQFKGTRSAQTALARLCTGDIKSLKFIDNENTYSSCPCSHPASPAHLIAELAPLRGNCEVGGGNRLVVLLERHGVINLFLSFWTRRT
ncbi:RNase H domain-containing protein [Nephila pilipes]|uniref:RNase H domain-containing protein n=1 Tax=Nephila pilipes TaxID=299642 RepID=A0A8X6MF76_NEPPI|nr:RNase H domain-containing protein [Nephila pilipes]GFS47089.1 RNase H domain-containing protein [Nephila pilipes]GFS92000.1 RNase H domain-containing protein [Nephila pilipes]GFU03074.1 RNase H domain-containing protein [Nephila pilipes]